MGPQPVSVTLEEIYGQDVADPHEDAYLAHRRTNWHRVSYRAPDGSLAPWRSVQTALARHFEWVVLNTDSHINFLAWDLDGGQVQAIERLEAWTDRTGITGFYVPTPHGAHFAIAIDPVSRSHARSVAYALDMWAGIGSQLNADPSYALHSIRNPLANFTVWQGLKVHTLGDLRAHVAPVGLLERAQRHRMDKGRNSALYGRLVAMDAPTLEDAERLNAAYSEPLPAHEVRSCLRSAQKGRRRRGGQILRDWGRRGGLRGSEAQGQARARNLEAVNASRAEISARRAAMARYLSRQGLSARDIAKRLAVNVRTVYRVVRLCSLEPCPSRTPTRPPSGPTASQHTRQALEPLEPPGNAGTPRSSS